LRPDSFVIWSINVRNRGGKNPKEGLKKTPSYLERSFEQAGDEG